MEAITEPQEIISEETVGLIEVEELQEEKEELQEEVEGLLEKLKPRVRPDVTNGETVRVKTGCGSLYVTVNSDEKGVCEVFSAMGRSGGCKSAQSEATCRLISLALRLGADVESVIKQVEGIRCPTPYKLGGMEALSCPDAIATAIKGILK